MPIKRTIRDGGAPVKVWTDEVDRNSLAQLTATSRLPVIAGHIAAMPDVHLGIGATVGSVIPTRRALIPAAVGVDIGCGMSAARLTLSADHLPDSLRSVRDAIENAVPVGFKAHDRTAADRDTVERLKPGLDRITDRHELRMRNLFPKWIKQLGTLGGGNHFIEVCLDEEDRVWVMLHSGSRGVGNAIGTHFIRLAQKDMRRHLADLPHRDLAYWEEGAEHFDDYRHAVSWAQDYAMTNRRLMMRLILRALEPHLPPFSVDGEAVQCHHNYVEEEEHGGETVFVTRKGAVRARKGDLGIIPGSMGARSYIVRGLGNPDSFCSSPHGAGRKMSRKEAKRTFTRADLEHQTRGIECRKDAGVVDEIPGAYKSIDEVMANASDLVEPLHTLRQVVCVKG